MILPTKPCTPRHKGKIERGVDYVKSNALKGRPVRQSRGSRTSYLQRWEATRGRHAHSRHDAAAGRQGSSRKVNAPALLPLPAERFPFFREGRRVVHRDGHVEVDKAYYSVPPEYLGRAVWVRWDGRLVRIFNDTLASRSPCTPSASRAGSARSGSTFASEKISGVERGAELVAGQGASRRAAGHALGRGDDRRRAASRACACCRAC